MSNQKFLLRRSSVKGKMPSSASGSSVEIGELLLNNASGDAENFLTSLRAGGSSAVTSDYIKWSDDATNEKKFATKVELEDSEFVTANALTQINKSAGFTEGGISKLPDQQSLTDAIIELQNKTQDLEESDPIFTDSPAAGITSADITNWNNKQNAISDLGTIRSNASTAHSWGNHANAGYTKNTGTVTSIKVQGTNGLTGSGTVTSSGTITISGIIATTSATGVSKLVDGDLNGRPYATGEAAAAAHTHSQYLTGYTEQYKGTITGIKMNGASKGTSGVVDLGSVLTSTAIKVNSASTADNATTSTKAIQDGDGQVITSTYSKIGHTHNASAVTEGTFDIARIPTGKTNTTIARGDHSHTAAEVGLESALKYHGKTNTPLYDGDTTNPIKINNKDHFQSAGCVVIYESQASGSTEFVWSGSKWEKLGDGINYKVKQEKVYDPSPNNTSYTFIDTISQDENGVIKPTKKSVPSGTTATMGVVKLVSGDLRNVSYKDGEAAAGGHYHSQYSSTGHTHPEYSKSDTATTETGHYTPTAKTSTYSGGWITSIKLDSKKHVTEVTTGSTAHTHNYKPLQTAVSDPAANGSALTFIDTISQDTNGVIKPTKKSVNLANYSLSGHNHDGKYSPVGHNHDDKYYTESEINTKLAGKSDTGHTHSASEITSGTFVADRIPKNIKVNSASTADNATNATNATNLGGRPINDFMTYEDSANYVNANFNDALLDKKAADTYIEYWSSNGGWYNSKWGTVSVNDKFIGNLQGKADSASIADSAIKDGNGNNIVNTYATKSSIPTVNNGKLSIKVNGTETAGFTANQSGNSTVNFSAGTNVTLTQNNGKITISATDTKYTHPTTSGNKHIPSGGSPGQFLGWSSDGTAAWVNNPNTDTATTLNGHYTPSTTASTASTSSGKYISGIKLDSKKHVVGITEGTLPTNTDTATTETGHYTPTGTPTTYSGGWITAIKLDSKKHVTSVTTASTAHTHSQYSPTGHTHPEYATTTALNDLISDIEDNELVISTIVTKINDSCGFNENSESVLPNGQNLTDAIIELQGHSHDKVNSATTSVSATTAKSASTVTSRVPSASTSYSATTAVSATNATNIKTAGTSNSKLFLLGQLNSGSTTYYGVYKNVNVYMKNGSLYASSDKTLKTHVENVNGDPELIKRIPKAYFHWNDDKDRNIQMGTYAQDLEEVYPELVTKGEDGIRGVAYDRLGVVALAGIDKLYEMIQQLQAKNDELENRIKELENK